MTGYVYCSCGGCFEIIIGDTDERTLCAPCEVHDCDRNGLEDCKVPPEEESDEDPAKVR